MMVNLLERTGNRSHNLYQTTDEELIRLCARGERDALHELIERYQVPMARFLSYIAPSPGSVENLLPLLFIQVWQEAPRFPRHCPANLWLYRTAAYIATMSVSQPESERETLPQSSETEAIRDFHTALAQLPSTDRVLLALFYSEQLDCEQIRKVMNLPHVILKARLSFARKRLRRLMNL